MTHSAMIWSSCCSAVWILCETYFSNVPILHLNPGIGTFVVPCNSSNSCQINPVFVSHYYFIDLIQIIITFLIVADRFSIAPSFCRIQWYYNAEWFPFKRHFPLLQIDGPIHVDSPINSQECRVWVVIINNLYHFKISQCGHTFYIYSNSIKLSHMDNLLLVRHPQLNRRPLQCRCLHSYWGLFRKYVCIRPKIQNNLVHLTVSYLCGKPHLTPHSCLMLTNIFDYAWSIRSIILTNTLVYQLL